MNYLDIIIPVRNEEENIRELVSRIHTALTQAKINYGVIFIDDHSTDQTFDLIKQLSAKFPVKVFKKEGKPGKAYSILEGVKNSQADVFAMIDGDLQYPPEAIPEMFKLIDKHGIVIAKRKKYKDSKIRGFVNKSCKFILGKILFNLDYDLQSGLKLFRREIIERLSEKEVYPWALDMPLLHTAIETGFSIGETEIDFEKRKHGLSKVNFLNTSWQIGIKALQLKLQPKKIYHIAPSLKNGMKGAGIAHNKKRYITHTTLNSANSAIQVLTLGQKTFIYLILVALTILLSWNFLFGMQIIIAFLSVIYFTDVLFNFFLIFKSFHFPPEISFDEEKLKKIDNNKLPIYTILCPLYKEAGVLPLFLDSIAKIDWPKSKLDVQLLLEEDDEETLNAIRTLKLPSYVRAIVVPQSEPKTKPKACNYGLTQAKGEYLVIYDAEDIPDPLQLKKAYWAFQNVSENVKCLQAKLNYHNPHQNLLTRLFTAEYSLWFDVILTGLQSIQTTIPLGGTSNHFKTSDLLSLQGWDPFNVTEDCDLGLRLFSHGYKTAIIDSTTLEEANSSYKNWVRQRSRWIKGYIQTYLVHMRNPIQLIKTQGWHSLIFQLVVGGKIAFMFINPFLWITTIAYFSFRSVVGESIEALYPSYIFYMAAFSLVFGNFMFLYYYMLGVAKRGHWTLMKYVYLVPFYWLAVSFAACKALYQLVVRPHYWEKTIHGLHLNKHTAQEVIADVAPVREKVTKQKPVIEPFPDFSRPAIFYRIGEFIAGKRLWISGAVLVLSSLIANFSNFVFNAFLGRKLSFEEFGELSVFSSLLFIASIPLLAFSQTVAQKCALIFGKTNKTVAKTYFNFLQNHVLVYAFISTLFWVAMIPFMMIFFHEDSFLPFLYFTPVWAIGLLSANYSGFLKGTLSFGVIGVMVVFEALTKLSITGLISYFGLYEFIVLSIPLSMLCSLIIAIVASYQVKGSAILQKELNFNKPFFSAAVISGISNISFLGVDVLLAKHFLSAPEAGQYSLLSLVGKMTYFLGSLFIPFMIPVVSKNLGAKKDNTLVFCFLFASTAALLAISFITLGIYGDITVPILFGEKARVITTYLPLYILTMSMFTISKPIIDYYQARENYSFALGGFAAFILQITLIFSFHKNLEEFLLVMFVVSVFSLSVVLALFLFRAYVKVTLSNIRDLYDLLFSALKLRGFKSPEVKKVLILNWRDIKHRWSGGAEVYVHSLAKQWIKKGYSVTIFCGNDTTQPRYEMVDGIQVIRRGGIYTVYLWAFLYYIFRLKGKFDVVIDSANGIPFFTPLYVRVPKFLLIHHVHQEIFRKHLMFPFSYIAMFLEGVVMPLLYRNEQLITVSESSKKELLKMRLTNSDNIEIINPGIEIASFRKSTKTQNPSVLYLGRLKPYKNVDVAIMAFSEVVKKIPNAQFVIAGTGETLAQLVELVKKLNLEKNVQFAGKVTDAQKAKLYAAAWVCVQPSSIEGWGITVIEANAAGTPVIASDVHGLRDSVIHRQTGILVKPRFVKSMSNAITEVLLDNVLRQKLSAQAYEWSRNFSWEKTSQNLEELIDKNLWKNNRRVIPGLMFEKA